MRRVVITGIGLVTPLGLDATSTWKGLLDGKGAVGPVRGFDASSLRTRLAAEIPGFDAKPFLVNRRVLRMMTRSDQLAVAGSSLAVKDSGLDFATRDGARCGLFVAGNKETSKLEPVLEGLTVTRGADGVADLRLLGEQAKSVLPPLFFVEGLQASPLFYISEAYGLKGANTYFAGTAESGAVAVGRAFRAIRRGEADVAIAGAFDDAASWWTLSKFDAMGFMTDRNELGAGACRPFDAERTGTVLGEGAAVLVLEEREGAKARGARVHAEVTGYGSATDAYAAITPHPEGRGLVRALEMALRDAGSRPEAIGYVAAHGSATKLGDRSEARAIRKVFGGAADRLVGSSVKGATGHLMAAAGALNVAVAALALEHQAAPPTLNLEKIDPDCALDWVKERSRPLRVEQAVALARGLAGQNVALALRAAQ